MAPTPSSNASSRSQAKEIERLKNRSEALKLLAQAALMWCSIPVAFQEIWETFADLRVAADRLWGRATERNVEEFGRRLEGVKRVIYKGSLCSMFRTSDNCEHDCAGLRGVLRGKSGIAVSLGSRSLIPKTKSR